MIKNKKNNNLLIKHNLLNLMKKTGITRVNSEALLVLNDYIEKHMIEIINALKEEIIVKGKKTLKKEDVDEVLKNFQKEMIEV